MRTAALILLATSILITACLIPVTNSLAGVTGRWGQPVRLGIVALCLLRGPALIAVFLLLIGAGRLDTWAPSRTRLAFLVSVGIVALEIGSFAMHDLSIAKYLHQPWLLLCAILATVLPLCVVLSGFLSSRTWFIIGTAGALAAGLISLSVHDPSKGSRNSAGMTRGEADAEYSRVRLAELRRLPADTRLQALFEFAGPMEPDPVRREALASIEAIPNSTAQLVELLNSDKRLDALFILHERLDRLPRPAQEQCWITAGLIANEMLERIKIGIIPTYSDVRKLYIPVKALSAHDRTMRRKHLQELKAVRDAIQLAHEKGARFEGTEALDTYLADIR